MGQVAGGTGRPFADLLQKKSIGAKEESGFTEGSTKNPIAFQAPSQALPGDPVSGAGPPWSRRETEALRPGNP